MAPTWAGPGLLTLRMTFILNSIQSIMTRQELHHHFTSIEILSPLELLKRLSLLEVLSYFM